MASALACLASSRAAARVSSYSAKIGGVPFQLAVICLGVLVQSAFVRDKRLIVQHATAHANMIAEPQCQAGRAIQVRAMRHVLHMEARGRAQVASTLRALHNMLLSLTTHRRALVLAEALRRRMYGAACAPTPMAQLVSIPPPPPPSPDSCRTGPVIGVCSAHCGGPAGFPSTLPTQTNTLHL